MWRNLWRRWRNQQSATPRTAAARRRPAHFRPRLEPLEDRLAPAVFAPLASTPDGDPGSLRADIIAANSNGQDNVINLQAAAYFLTLNNVAGQENAAATGDLDLTAAGHSITIQGAGPDQTFILYENVIDRVFQVFSNVTVVFRNLTITGGTAVDDGTTGATQATSDALGGGILDGGGNVTLDNVHLKNNRAEGGTGRQAEGGGIYVSGGSLTILNSTIDRNGAAGGLGADGKLTASGAGGDGGGAQGGAVFATGSTLTLVNNTLTSNRADGGQAGNGAPDASGGAGGAGGNATGGGIAALGCTLTVSGSTFSANAANGGDGGSAGAGNGSSSGSAGGSGGTGAGGALFVSNGSLSASDSTIAQNIAHAGSGLAGGDGLGGGNGGDGGQGAGGGLFTVGATVVLSRSALASNTAAGGNAGPGGQGISGVGGLFPPGGNGGAGGGAGGGGFLALGGTVTLSNSTISSNTAVGGNGDKGGSGPGTGGNGGNGGASVGGGLAVGAATANLRNSTIAFNKSDVSQGGGGGGPTPGKAGSGGTGQGGGVRNDGGTVNAVSTIFGNNIALGGTEHDFSGTFATATNNLLANGTGATGIANGAGGNIVGADPRLLPLAFYGGPTLTHALLSDSPAIDAGSNPDGLVTDQRGFTPRAFNGATDIGAFESGATAPVPASISVSAGASQSALVNTAFATALQATVLDAAGHPVGGVTVTFTAPLTGPSGTFAGGLLTVTATTDASGVASAPAFAANGTAGGPYAVTAGVNGVAPAANFSLTNTAPVPPPPPPPPPPLPVFAARVLRRKGRFLMTVTDAQGVVRLSLAFRFPVQVLRQDVNGDGVLDFVVLFRQRHKRRRLAFSGRDLSPLA